MATFYKGVGPGTFLYAQDFRLTGLAPHAPGSLSRISSLMSHITHGTTMSGYISLTKSYGVARAYAFAGRIPPSATSPGFVYEIEINDPPPAGLTLVDPICEIGSANVNPGLRHTYHHDGDQSLLLGIADPIGMAHHLGQMTIDPPNSGRTPRHPTISIEMEAMVRALRDAEVLVAGNIPTICFVHRHDVY